MPTLHLKSSEFADIVACFLLDKLTNPADVIPIEINENFDDLSVIMQNKGMRAVLLKYYMTMNPQMRIQYKMIKDVFTTTDKASSAYIYIEKEQKPPQEVSKTRKFLKTMLKIGLVGSAIKLLTGKKK